MNSFYGDVRVMSSKPFSNSFNGYSTVFLGYLENAILPSNGNGFFLYQKMCNSIDGLQSISVEYFSSIESEVWKEINDLRK